MNGAERGFKSMFQTSAGVHRRLKCLLLSASALALSGAAAFAQEPAADGDAPRPTVSRKSAASSNATINLVNLLVKQGVLTQEQASGLIKQAEDEAYVARQAAKDANAKADEASRQASAASAAASPPGVKRVTYVPDLVKKQLRDEIREEVMAKAKSEGWASPGKYPEWASRVRIYGDIRGRYERVGFPSGNDPAFVNFGAINSGSPYDVSDTNQGFPPYFNTAEDRQRFRLRARVGLEADLSNGFSAGFRVATGENNSPVSTNQTFGSNGGDFSKYAIWLDRAYLAWEPFKNEQAEAAGLVSKDGGPLLADRYRSATVLVGRFDNPFFSPTELVWDSDLGFDGVAVKGEYEVADGIRPFLAGGAFPIFNTDFNAGFNLDEGNNFPSKSKSDDRYLFGGQIGVAGTVAEDYAFRFGASYFDFTNVQGKLSSPCFVSSSSTACDTDILRPTFAQKGNTYRPLRNIVPLPNNPNSNQFQYYGLASDYRTVVLTGQLDLGQFDPVHVVFDGEYVKNVAFNKRQISKVAVNNLGPDRANGDPGRFDGGDTGWAARMTVGHKEIKRLWDWNVNVGYRYLESDATLDAFADSDFGLGGTNLKGYILGGSLGLADNVWASAKWMSADNVAGAPYSVDIFQLDLNAKF